MDQVFLQKLYKSSASELLRSRGRRESGDQDRLSSMVSPGPDWATRRLVQNNSRSEQKKKKGTQIFSYGEPMRKYILLSNLH